MTQAEGNRLTNRRVITHCDACIRLCRLRRSRTLGSAPVPKSSVNFVRRICGIIISRLGPICNELGLGLGLSALFLLLLVSPLKLISKRNQVARDCIRIALLACIRVRAGTQLLRTFEEPNCVLQLPLTVDIDGSMSTT